MKRILVGYDGSEPAGHALDRAGELAARAGAELTVLTAADDRLVREDGIETPAADEQLARWVADQGARRARSRGAARAVPRTSLLKPADALAEAARDGYDLVVVGHRGLGALKELFMGSTAKELVDRVETSVLVVR